MASALWNIAAWTAAAGAIGAAAVLSYREIHFNIPNDLRNPLVLAADAILAAMIAFGFALFEGTLKRWGDVHLCFRFGLWAAAVFRLIPPIINEKEGLFLRDCGSFDLPYIVLGALIHGGLVLLACWPYGIRLMERPGWSDDQGLWKLCGTTVLVFFVVAAVVRLASESWR